MAQGPGVVLYARTAKIKNPWPLAFFGGYCVGRAGGMRKCSDDLTEAGDPAYVELLVQSHATLVLRLQNLLPARSHDIRHQLDSAIFASHVRAQLVPPELKPAVDFTWHMLRMVGTAAMDRAFEEAYASIMSAPVDKRTSLFLRRAHEQLDMISRSRGRSDTDEPACLRACS